jgi:DNA repair protein RadC
MTHYNDQTRRPRRLIREMPAAEQPLNRLQTAGPQAMSTSELLSIVLGTGDGLDLAMDVLTQFGDLAELSRLSLAQLEQIEGIGKGLAARLKSVFALADRVNVARQQDERTRITSPDIAANYMMPRLRDLEQEEVWLLCLDTRNRVIAEKMIYRGTVNTCVIRPAEILRTALLNNAVCIMLFHNHPSGDPTPSPEDVSMTRQLKRLGDQMDISLLDHIVIGNLRYVSLKERSLGFD